jgi:hypothetical protein
METYPNSANGKEMPPNNLDPSRYTYRNALAAAEDPERRRVRARSRKERIRQNKNKLGFIMAMAHGAVELSLRREPRRVRRVVRADLDRQYGLKIPRTYGF